jgi:hypothetical protein
VAAGFSLSRALQLGLPEHLAAIEEVSMVASKEGRWVCIHMFMCGRLGVQATALCVRAHRDTPLLRCPCHHSLEAALDKMQAQWAGLCFDTTPWRATGCSILRGVDDIQQVCLAVCACVARMSAGAGVRGTARMGTSATPAACLYVYTFVSVCHSCWMTRWSRPWPCEAALTLAHSASVCAPGRPS